VLTGVPVLAVVGGLMLPVAFQGLALALAVLPAAERRSLIPGAALMGILATTGEVVALDLLGVGVTRSSVTVVCLLVTLAGCAAAGSRRARPSLTLPGWISTPARALSAGVAAMLVAGAVVGGEIPVFTSTGFSSVAFAGSPAHAQGVVTAQVNHPIPVTIRIANAERSDTVYRAWLQSDETPARAAGQVVIGAGASALVPVGWVSVQDGCLHRVGVAVSSPKQRYLLTLYLKASTARCPRARSAGRSVTTSS
jgi:hypothetical protein